MGKKIRVVLLADFVFSLLCTGFATMMTYLEDRTLSFIPEVFLLLFVFTYLIGLASLLGFYGKKMPGAIMAISLTSAALAGGGLGFIASGNNKIVGILIGSVAMMALMFLGTLPRRFHDV